jgi:ABC-type amino acid transport substrate-binding protein
LSGALDIICHASVRWNPSYKDDVEWSEPIYSYNKVLVSNKNIPFSHVDQVKNTTIGTVNDFAYPDLDKSFKNQKLFRDDAPTVDANVVKLLGGRLDYIVMSELEFTFHSINYPELQRSTFILDKADIRCALSKKSSLSLEKLNGAIERLRAKKVLQKIWARYSNPRTIPAPLVYGLNNNDSPPFIFFEATRENPKVKGGVFFDLALEVGKQIQRPLIFALLPRGRLDSDLADGQVDLVCFNTEAWAGKFAKNYFWSVPIFRQVNYIVTLKNLAKESSVKSLKELSGLTIGTTLHFVYPTLDPYFEKGTLIREDADSGLANVTKLNFKRVNYIVLNNLEYIYYKKTNPLLQKIPIEIDPIDVKCAISKKSNLKLNQINAAIFKMKKNGQLDKVFAQ